MDIYWKSSTADVKHPRTEPRPGSRADVASDLPATRARNPPFKKTGTKTGAATKEAASHLVVLTQPLGKLFVYIINQISYLETNSTCCLLKTAPFLVFDVQVLALF